MKSRNFSLYSSVNNETFNVRAALRFDDRIQECFFMYKFLRELVQFPYFLLELSKKTKRNSTWPNKVCSLWCL